MDVKSLQPGDHYYLPGTPNDCECSTVFYSLMSACGLCQSASYKSWSDWNATCIRVLISKYRFDIPDTTSIPHWAYLDVVSADRFLPGVAQHNGTISPSSTSTSTSTSSSTTTTPAVSSSNKSSAGPIAGGVVGCVVGLAAIAALVFFMLRRRSGYRKPMAIALSLVDPSPAASPTMSSMAVSPFQLTPQPKPSEMFDPNTYLGAPPPYDNPNSSGPTYISSNQKRQYHGIPQI